MPARCAVRLVVLDGLDWEWTLDHLDMLPYLRGLMEAGCSARLDSSVPITPAGVAALLAGRDVEASWYRPGEDLYASSADLVRTRPWLWPAARDYGLTVGLLGVPLTWPAFPLPTGSWLVSGFPAGRLDEARLPWRWPASLDILAYPFPVTSCGAGPGGPRDLGAVVYEEEEAVEWLLGSAPRCDVEVVWLRSTDAAGHHAWGTGAYSAVARAADMLLARLRDGAEALIVLSDHGMAALGSPRTAAYLATTHGPTAKAAGLVGGHAVEGLLVAAGERVGSRGDLAPQRLAEVAGGVFDLLGLPPPAGVLATGPAWARRTTAEDEAAVRSRLQALGYVP